MTSSTNQSTRGLRLICLALIIIGVIAACYGVVRRVQAERSARAVELVVDYPEIQALADTQGLPIDTVMTRLRDAGATAVALPEETLKSLQEDGTIAIMPRGGWRMDNGQIQLAPEAVLTQAYSPEPQFSVVTTDPQVRVQIVDGLRRACAKKNINTDGSVIRISGAEDSFSGVGLGISPMKVAHITHAGLRVVPRLLGSNGNSERTLRAAMAAVANALPKPQDGRPRGIVVFDGTSIPGYRTLIPTLADELTRNGLIYGSVEFGKQKGDPNLGAKLEGQLVRVHSISLDELSTMSPAEAWQRFALAVKDRNIRVLYVHFPPTANIDPLQGATEYVHGIAREINGMHGMGFVVSTSKMAHPFTPLSVPGWLLFLLFVASGASVVLWLVVVLPEQLPRAYVRWGYGILALGLLGAAGTALRLAGPGRMLFGLLAAIGFPLLSLTWSYRRVDRLAEHPPVHRTLVAVGALLTATGITVLGGLLIAAMMGESTFLVKVGQFSGVKVALSLPLLLFAVMVVSDGVARRGESFTAYLERGRSRVRDFFAQPLHIWGAVISIVALGIVGVMLARSGNDGGVGVSGMELKLRSILEQWMIARPRTKEFAFGVPLFLFSMVAAANRRRQLALVLLLGAAIGQVDVLNTYCHSHTPVLLSLLRTVNGIWLGIIIGVVLLALFARTAIAQRMTMMKVAK